MAIAEGKTLPFETELAIQSCILETFPYTGEKQLINYETKEFSAVCPFSGLPDFADIKIQYIPNKKIIELKSLKYYFLSFRNVGIYQEHVTNRIFKDLTTVLSPKYLKLTTIYNTRGGIDAQCSIDSGPFPV